MNHAFDKFLLVGCLCVIFSVLLYFFYWNRLIAFLLGLFFRFLYWNQGPFSIWLEIGSIHFSLLTGRVMFKDLSYHSSNQTIRIVKGQLQWRYWIRRPASGHDIAPPQTFDLKQTRPVPCRVQVSLQGFEWYLHNRTAAFDAIVSEMGVKVPLSRATSGNTGRQSSQKSAFPVYSPSILAASLRLPVAIQRAWTWIRRQMPTLDVKDLLPLGIDVTKGAITCGNSSVENIMVVQFQRTEGMFGVVQSRSKYDLHKQLLHLTFEQALVRLVQNEDYRGSMNETGINVQKSLKSGQPDRRGGMLSYHGFAKLWRRMRLYGIVRKFPLKHTQSSRFRSHRKHKSAEDETPVGADFDTLEYAIDRKILEAPVFELTYYTDVVGDVPALPHPFQVDPSVDIGNGDMGPEWGVDLVIRGGALRYGPWADRQRSELQKVFFPATYQNVEPTPRLKPGDKRAWTAMQIFIELREDTTLSIPFREASKNWQWDGKADMPRRPKRRDPASILLTVGDRSSINYIVPMVATTAGYESTLEVHLDTIVVTSSLNDIQMVAAESCRVRGELPSPLQWNALRTWAFSISLRNPVLYLLRDHINMFTDLGKDWASGPPSDHHRFVPTIYAVDLDLHHYELNLYVNDHNIIDKPLVREENALLTARADRWKTSVQIPSDRFRPEATTIPFSIELPEIQLHLTLPRWNTFAEHAPKEGNSLARATVLRLDGSYRYFADTHPDHVEQFKLSITSRDLAYKGLGWSIRFFLILQNNYLGSFTTFTTLFEYLDQKKRGVHGDQIMQQYRQSQRNMMQVDLEIDLQNALMVVPAGLSGYEASASLRESSASPPSIGSCVLLDIPELQVHFRLHDYFMGTISASIEPNFPENMRFARLKRKRHDILLIDGIDITSNRLFGPMPRTLPYVCIWELRLGAVKTTMTAQEASVLSCAGASFGLTFTDPANAPAAAHHLALYPDVTFLKAAVGSVDATWSAGRAAVTLSMSHGLEVDFNDKGSQYHRKLTRVKVPHVAVQFMLRADQRRWLETGRVQADAYLDIYSSPVGWKDKAADQADFIFAQDFPTGRARRMFNKLRKDEKPVKHLNSVFLPQPDLSTAKRYRVSAELPGETTSNRMWHKIGHFSESDMDGEQLDVLRDAKLAAQARASARTEDRDDERSISDGDESDTEEVSDGTFSEDGWSQFESATDDLTELRRYSRLCRQFTAPFLSSPTRWEGSPFTLVKGPRLSNHFRHSRSGHPAARHDTSALLGVAPDNEVDTTVMRFACRQDVQVFVTPLVIPVLAELEFDVSHVRLSPELAIDGLFSSYINSFGELADVPTTTILDLNVASASLNVLHDIHLKDTATVAPTGHLRLHLGRSHVALCTLSRDRLTLDVNLERAEVVFNDAVGRETSSIVDAALSQVTLSHGADHSQAVFGGCTVHISQLALEHLAGLTVAVSLTARRIGSIVERWQRHQSTHAASVIQAILQATQDRPIIDPLSSIQPSFLVQTGLPQSLRLDTVFRLLFHLRSCLWDAGEQITTVTEPDTETLHRLLSKRLAGLDPDAFHENGLALMHPLFPDLRPVVLQVQPEQPTGLVRSGTIELLQFAVIMQDPSGATAGQFSVERLAAKARVRRCDMVDALPASHQVLGISQVSLRHHLNRQEHQQIFLSLSTDQIALAVSPRLIPFAREGLRVQRDYAHAFPAKPKAAAESRIVETASKSLDLVLGIRKIKVEAAADALSFELGSSGLQVVSTLLTRPHHPLSASCSGGFGELFLRARTPTDASIVQDKDILASLTLTSGKAHCLTRSDPKAANEMRIIFSIDDAHLRVPRSALRLFRFVQQWRADFLPGIEATVQDFLAELERIKANRPEPKAAPTPQSQLPPIVHVDARVKTFGVSLQVMLGTWLSWRVNNVVAFLNSLAAHKQVFGLQLDSQTFSITSRSNSNAAGDTKRLKVLFPPFSMRGDRDQLRVHAMAVVDFLEFRVKLSHWDTLLAVQQKFGQDFTDLMSIVQETRSSAPSRPQQPESTGGADFKYSVFVKMRGFRIGLEGPSSTFYLECFDFGGSIDNLLKRKWSGTMTDLALSLAPKANVEPRNESFNRKRSAFVIIDLEVQGVENTNAAGGINNVLQVAVTKIHAVMQTSSVGEVGDFVDHLQAELWDRKEQRAVELAAFKQKAESILKTFELEQQTTPQTEPDQPSWMKSYAITLSVQDVGVAFPLTNESSLEIPQTGSRDSHAVRAFLFSIRSIKFGTHGDESGEARMSELSFQFRQSVPSDFAGHTHVTLNRLMYPEMKASLRSMRTVSAQNVWMRAEVDGFVLDIDSSIPDYIFSLVDVYEQSKDRVTRLSASLPRPEAQSPSPEYTASAAVASNVFASLMFESGKVRIYHNAASEALRANPVSHVADDVDVFNLPEVSVWSEYRSSADASDPSILVFKSTIHSSQNTVRPTTLLPFLTELVGRVENRMRQATDRRPVSTADTLVVPDAIKPAAEELSRARRLQMTFSLRIDQSKLEFTCQPDVNVIAGLHWDSGGFVLHVAPGSRQVTLSATIAGLTVGLKHGFLSEECASLDMRNLTFSVTFAKMVHGGKTINSVSLVSDTEILGAVRFSRLQDILCFKAVWLDRIPVFNNQSAGSSKSSVSAPAQPANAALPITQEFTTLLLIRVRQISLEVDLGQSISTINLDFKDAMARTKITEQLSDVLLSVGHVSMTAKGHLSGTAQVSNCIFQTVRRIHLGDVITRDCMLELRMTSDALVVVLESDHQKLLHYRAEPLELEIYDDWSMISPQVPLEDRAVRFSVSVESPEIVAVVTIGTLPKLLSYANKFKANLDAQREGASRESKAFSMSQMPNPDNPLSAVAEAMLVSAKTRFRKEPDSGLSYAVKQNMRLRLGLLRLVVSARSMTDGEVAQFIGRNVCASLERIVKISQPPQRRLELAFSLMTIARLQHISPQQLDVDWLASLPKSILESTIVGLPSMEILMTSQEAPDGALEYEFDSQFNRLEGLDTEDIFISLNIALYLWLTGLRKNLTREMEQVKATTEWRTSVSATRKEATASSTDASKRMSRMTARVPALGHIPEVAPPPLDKDQNDPPSSSAAVVYRPMKRHIERLTMRQLGEATPDVMHPFFMKKAGFNLEDSFPQYVNEYATGPLEEIMDVLLKFYTRQLLAGSRNLIRMDD
ncbi:unnamed protein product [Mycena citricolor]|uniref:Csf1 N-terminal domain-containing protein n=1 Tax=Mycena citricolor TaxID=2018698 RepID=A0AAD2H152_9AGAR|nr:unnamed protein product [Mycena citricolor]